MKGGHHVTCQGKVPRDAAIYPRPLCRAVLKGISDQLNSDGKLRPGCFGIQAEDDENTLKKDAYGPAEGYSGKYKDATTGQTLRDDLVAAARAEELTYFTKKGVWVKVPKGAGEADDRPWTYLGQMGRREQRG